MDEVRVAFAAGVTPDKWAKVWRERHPELPLRLIPLADDSIGRGVLDDGSADLALLRLPVDLDSPASLHCVRLYEEIPVVVASREHYLAAADPDEPIAPDDLREEQHVLPHPDIAPSVEQLPFPAMSVADAVETAASGSGVVVLPMSLARLHHRKDVITRPVDLPGTTIALLWLRDADSDLHQDFVGVVRGRRASSSRQPQPEPARTLRPARQDRQDRQGRQQVSRGARAPRRPGRGR